MMHNSKINSLLVKNEQIIKSRENFEKKLGTISGDIASKRLIIKLEKELRTFPSQAIGSVVLYNGLNEKFDQFTTDQFNKIVRFLSHVESMEKKYRELYVDCTEKYHVNPKNIPIVELRKERKAIDLGYSLLSILVNEVQGDLVKFNQVYNKLEDEGLFMTVPEKRTQEYLCDISNKMDNVINGLKVLFQTLQETNRSLREIEGGISDIASINTGIYDQLWDISLSE